MPTVCSVLRISTSDSTTPSSQTPHHPSPRLASTTARVKPRRLQTCRTSTAIPSSARWAWSSSVPSSTSHSSCTRLCRRARSLTHEKNAAPAAKTRNVDALTSATRSLTRDVGVENVGVRCSVREQEQERAPDREPEAGAVRDEQCLGRDEEEHEEQEWAAVATGVPDRDRQHEPFHEHDRQDEHRLETRASVFARPPP